MNPLEFLFKSLQSLNTETALLEACEWDEDRVLYVKDCLETSLAEILKSNDTFSLIDISKEIRKKMLNTISEKEANVCLHIVDGLLHSTAIIKGDSYEN